MAATEPYLGRSSICEVDRSWSDPAVGKNAVSVRPLTLAGYTHAYEQWVAQRVPDASQEPEGQGQGQHPPGRRSSLDLQAAEWHDKARFYGRARGVVPDKVVHNRPCSGLCARGCPSASYRMFVQVKKALSDEASTTQKSPFPMLHGFPHRSGWRRELSLVDVRLAARMPRKGHSRLAADGSVAFPGGVARRGRRLATWC